MVLAAIANIAADDYMNPCSSFCVAVEAAVELSPVIVFVRVVHEASAVGEDGCVFEDAACGGVGGSRVCGSILLAKDVFS